MSSGSSTSNSSNSSSNSNNSSNRHSNSNDSNSQCKQKVLNFLKNSYHINNKLIKNLKSCYSLSLFSIHSKWKFTK